MSSQLIAFHNDVKIKNKYLSRVRAHRKADELIRGQYWANGKGCAVGCTIHGSSHSQYEVELGIPRLLARLEDAIFEGLPNGYAKNWPEQFLDAIRVGADLSGVWPRFAFWLLLDPVHGVIKHANTDQTRKSITRVGELYHRQIHGNIPTAATWRSAADAADAAWRSAADAADAAWRSAAAAADAAWRSAADAADAAWRSAADAADAADAWRSAAWRSAADDARSTSFKNQSIKLLELLRKAPVVALAT